MKLKTSFFNDIRELILSACFTVARGVDLVQVNTKNNETNITQFETG